MCNHCLKNPVRTKSTETSKEKGLPIQRFFTPSGVAVMSPQRNDGVSTQRPIMNRLIRVPSNAKLDMGAYLYTSRKHIG